MNRYTIHCTEEQTKKAFNLGAPLEIGEGKGTILCRYQNYHTYQTCVIPTADQMIGWLEEKGFYFYIFKDCLWNGEVQYGSNWYHSMDDVNSRETATLAVIDAALDYLIKTEK